MIFSQIHAKKIRRVVQIIDIKKLTFCENLRISAIKERLEKEFNVFTSSPSPLLLKEKGTGVEVSGLIPRCLQRFIK